MKGQSIHHYFIAKAVRLLNEGGLVAMVVPCYLLDNLKNHARHYISEYAELVCAYRLPDSLFDNAKVTVDLIWTFNKNITVEVGLATTDLI